MHPPSSAARLAKHVHVRSVRQHSSTSGPSAAYLRSDTAAATRTTPQKLTPAHRRLLESIIRVDQAGELAANQIYKGQLAVFRTPELRDLIQDMWDGEKKHLQTMNQLVTQHRVRPTVLYPFWKAAGWCLGAATAAMGKEAGMACTEAVETVIGEHYNDQIKAIDTLPSEQRDHPSIALLRAVLVEFRDDELEHLDTAVKNDAQKAPAHALLSAIIAAGCRGAIAMTEKI